MWTSQYLAIYPDHQRYAQAFLPPVIVVFSDFSGVVVVWTGPKDNVVQMDFPFPIIFFVVSWFSLLTI